jgi:DNA-binding transcriptional MerR regulator
VGLLDPAKRTKSGQQLFDHTSIKRIKLIKKLNESGYPLREIRDIFLKNHPE